MRQGVVIKAYNSFYYVQHDEAVIMCTVRGRFKKERFSLLVGDEVVYSLTGEGKGVVEEILPRRTLLQRPMVANVTQVVLTFAAANPDLNISLIDKFLVVAEASELKTVLCINKADLADRAMLESISELYRSIGYPVIIVSAQTGEGVAALRECLFDQITVFSGPSGVGKSSLLNAIEPGLTLMTGAVSEKIGRGKHTTRFAQLLPLAGGGFVVDTPGFSFTEFAQMKEQEVAYCFPEMAMRAAECHFNTCLHDKEPKCAVKEAVATGEIYRSRYETYLEILQEIREQRSRY